MANHPEIADGFMAFARVVYGDRQLTPQLRELAYLTATKVNHCHY